MQNSEFKLMQENAVLKKEVAHLEQLVRDQVCDKCEAEKEYNKVYMRGYRRRQKQA